MNTGRSAKTARLAKMSYDITVSYTPSMADESYTIFLKVRYLSIISIISTGSIASGSMAVEGERRWTSLSYMP